MMNFSEFHPVSKLISCDKRLRQTTDVVSKSIFGKSPNFLPVVMIDIRTQQFQIKDSATMTSGFVGGFFGRISNLSQPLQKSAVAMHISANRNFPLDGSPFPPGALSITSLTC